MKGGGGNIRLQISDLRLRIDRTWRGANRTCLRPGLSDSHVDLLSYTCHFPPTSNQQQQPVFSIQHPVSCIQHIASSIQHPASSIQHRSSSIQHPASSIQQPVTRNQIPEDREQKSEDRYSGFKSSYATRHALCALPYA
jgi:hypothetical protein